MLLLTLSRVSGKQLRLTVYHSRSDTVGREGNLFDAYRTCTYYSITYIGHQAKLFE